MGWRTQLSTHSSKAILWPFLPFRLPEQLWRSKSLVALGQAATKLTVCGSRKYPYPPGKIIGNSEGEGGFKGSNFQGVKGFHGKRFPIGRQTTFKTLKAMYVRSEAQKHTYICCFETKVGTPGHWDEVNIISFNVSVFLWVSQCYNLQKNDVFETKSKKDLKWWT